MIRPPTLAPEGVESRTHEPIFSYVKLEQEPTDGAEQLHLRRDGSLIRHVLAGRMVQSGDELELLLSDGRWLRGRYEWTGVPVVWPALRITLTGTVSPTSERKLTGAMPLPPSARLRWPG